MKKSLALVASVTLALTLAACGGGNTGTDNPLPQGTTSSAPEEAPEEEEAPKATSCDVAREAILTGTKKEKEKAFKALIKDKKADATAREAANDYFETDDKDLKEMQEDLIQMACSL